MVQTLAQMVWGTFFGEKVHQSARLSAGGGGQKLFRQCPNAPCMNLSGASLILIAAWCYICLGRHYSVTRYVARFIYLVFHIAKPIKHMSDLYLQ